MYHNQVDFGLRRDIYGRTDSCSWLVGPNSLTSKYYISSSDSSNIERGYIA